MGIRTPFNPMGAFPKAAVDPYPDASFVFRHYLTAAQLAYTMPLMYMSDRTSKFTIDWGDGTPQNSYTTYNAPTHTYATAGTYDVQILDPDNKFAYFGGSITAWRNAAFKFEILKFESSSIYIISAGFHSCTGLTGKIPDLTRCPALTNIYGAFYGCTGLTGVAPNLAKAVSSQASIAATWPVLTNTAGFVNDSNADIRALFPTTWGGTKVIS